MLPKTYAIVTREANSLSFSSDQPLGIDITASFLHPFPPITPKLLNFPLTQPDEAKALHRLHIPFTFMSDVTLQPALIQGTRSLDGRQSMAQDVYLQAVMDTMEQQPSSLEDRVSIHIVVTE